MPVRVPGPDRNDRHGRPKGRQQVVGGRGRAAVVGDLEHVDGRQPAPQQDGVDVVLGVAREQEAAVLVFAEQD